MDPSKRETDGPGAVRVELAAAVPSLQDRDFAVLRAIVEGTAGNTGEEFFRSLVRHLAQAIGVRTPSSPSSPA